MKTPKSEYIIIKLRIKTEAYNIYLVVRHVVHQFHYGSKLYVADSSNIGFWFIGKSGKSQGI